MCSDAGWCNALPACWVSSTIHHTCRLLCCDVGGRPVHICWCCGSACGWPASSCQHFLGWSIYGRAGGGTRLCTLPGALGGARCLLRGHGRGVDVCTEVRAAGGSSKPSICVLQVILCCSLGRSAGAMGLHCSAGSWCSRQPWLLSLLSAVLLGVRCWCVLQGAGCCWQPAGFTHPQASDGACSQAREPAPRPRSGEAAAAWVLRLAIVYLSLRWCSLLATFNAGYFHQPYCIQALVVLVHASVAASSLLCSC
jgi:hypothetical protein